MVQPPFCDNDNNPNHDNGCGSKLEAYVYFLSFTLLGSWIMLNLFLAVVLENYESSGDDSKVIDEYDIENFKTVWMKIDKKGEGVIRVTSLRALLMQVGSLPCPSPSERQPSCLHLFELSLRLLPLLAFHGTTRRPVDCAGVRTAVCEPSRDGKSCIVDEEPLDCALLYDCTLISGTGILKTVEAAHGLVRQHGGVHIEYRGSPERQAQRAGDVLRRAQRHH
jgi:hypothetical protein